MPFEDPKFGFLTVRTSIVYTVCSPCHLRNIRSIPLQPHAYLVILFALVYIVFLLHTTIHTRGRASGDPAPCLCFSTLLLAAPQTNVCLMTLLHKEHVMLY